MVQRERREEQAGETRSPLVALCTLSPWNVLLVLDVKFLFHISWNELRSTVCLLQLAAFPICYR